MALAATILAGGCGRPLDAGPHPILLLAVDGVEPTLVDRFVSEGRMPNFGRLIERGTRTRIEAEDPLTSPVVWTTVATGRRPDAHGIDGWIVDGHPAASTDRRVPAFWSIFAANGRSTAAIGWLATWPPEPDSGVVVSDRLHSGEPDAVAPPDALVIRGPFKGPSPEDVERVFIPRAPDSATGSSEDHGSRRSEGPRWLIDERLLRAFYRDSIYFHAAEKLLSEAPYRDLTAVYLRGTDDVGHGFWKYFDPKPFEAAGQPVSIDEQRSLGEIIPRFYALVDGWTRRLTELAGNDVNVVIVSDHGMGTALPPFELSGNGTDGLSGNHRVDAELILAGPGFEAGARPRETVRHVDLLPTLLHLAGLPISRELEGRVLGELLSPAVRSRPIRFVDAYGIESGATRPTPSSESSDEALLEHLRALGYVQ